MVLPMSAALHYSPHSAATAIVLSGGGARAAYQVGVLQALSRLRQNAGADHAPTPFPIAVGTSAGAINAAGLACGAEHFDLAVQRLSRVWRNFSTSQVYRADAFGVMRSGARWLSLLTLGWALTRWHHSKPRSLLDNAPLLELLPLEKIPHLLRKGTLSALAITASSYTTGEHITFYEAGPHVPSWSRTQRRAIQDRISHQHLMASSSIPFIFPPAELMLRGQYNYLGDGAMRQTAPLAPAIHLGAQRIVVVGVGRSHEVLNLPQGEHPPFPSLAQVAGHALSSIFLDTLPLDVERALAAAEAGPEGAAARIADWRARRVPEVMAQPLEQALGLCWPWGDPEIAPLLRRQWAEAVQTALGEPGVTMAVAQLRVLAEPDGVLDTLQAQGYEIEGPAWKSEAVEVAAP